MTRVKSFFEWPMSRDGIVTSRRHSDRTSFLFCTSSSLFRWLFCRGWSLNGRVFLALADSTGMFSARWGIFHSVLHSTSAILWTASCYIFTLVVFFVSSTVAFVRTVVAVQAAVDHRERKQSVSHFHILSTTQDKLKMTQWEAVSQSVAGYWHPVKHTGQAHVTVGSS